MTSLTVVTLLVVAYGVWNAKGYARALALAGATPMGAAAIAGAVAVPTFYAVSIGALAGVLLRFLRTSKGQRVYLPAVPGVRALVLLVAVGVLVTLLAPLMFDGLAVMTPTGGDGALSAGLLTKSNIAQIVYLVLGVAVVVFLARARWAGPEVVGVALCAATVLSFWSWAGTQFGVPFPRGFFDNSPAFMIQDRLPNGLPRVRGIFSEPAALATSCLMTIAYGLGRLPALTVARRVGMLVVVAMASYLGFICTSATFFVAGAVTACLVAAVALSTFLLRGRKVSQAAAAALCVAAVAALWVLPWVAGLLDAVIDDKVASSSYTDRSSADADSLQLVWDTYGLGVGLGSNRASSFATSLLSTVGVVGAALFVAAVWAVVRQGYADPTYRPVVWVLVALLTAKVISGPDLNEPSGVMWMALGVLAHTALRRGRPGRPRPRTASPVGLTEVAGAASMLVRAPRG